MEKKLVSVVVLLYKKMDYLKENIDSILMQNYPNIEIIISDDGSDNFNKEFIEFLLKEKKENIANVKIIHHEKNLGIVKNFNEAIKNSRGDYIFPLAADDIFYSKNSVTEIVEAFFDETLIVTGLRAVYDVNMRNLKEIEPSQIVRYYLKRDLEKLYKFLIINGNKISGASTYYKKEVFEKYGFFNEGTRLIEDYPFILKMLRNRVAIKFLEKTTIKYRENGVSSGISPNPMIQKDNKYILENELEINKGNEKREEIIKYAMLKDKKEKKKKYRKIYYLTRIQSIANSILKKIFKDIIK